MIPENPAGPETAAGEDVAEWAALHALDALEGAERTAFMRRVENDPAAAAELQRARAVVAALSAAAPAVAPRPEVFEHLLARVRAESCAPSNADGARPWRNWRDGRDRPSDFAYVAASEGGFEATAFRGVSVRRLNVDRPRDRITMLVRMEPGSSYPAHRHGGAEECYVLAGDIQVGRQLQMHAGDYQRAEQGSVHPVQATQGGCLLLIVSSIHDELLASSAG